MLTDSRSFLSYSTAMNTSAEACAICSVRKRKRDGGRKIWALLGKMVEDISYNNARAYFDMECQ